MTEFIGDIVSVEYEKLIVKLRPDIKSKPVLGEFVGIDFNEVKIIGVISGVVNKIKEELLPYMDQEKVPKFLPYIEDYSENMVLITTLGSVSSEGPNYNCSLIASLKSPVERLSKEKIREFHNEQGRFNASYMFRKRNEISPAISMQILSTLENLLPESSDSIKSAKRFYENGGFK